MNITFPRYISRNIRMLQHMPLLAKKLNLTIAKLERLRHQFIGLDQLKRKLLLIRKEKEKIACCVIDLKDVQHCSVKKVYGSIRAGELQKKGLNSYLESVSLYLRFRSGKEPVALQFYDNRYHTKKQLSSLEAAARKWEKFVSTLLPGPSFAG